MVPGSHWCLKTNNDYKYKVEQITIQVSASGDEEIYVSGIKTKTSITWSTSFYMTLASFLIYCEREYEEEV